MSTISKNGNNLYRINGRLRFLRHISAIAKVSHYEFHVERGSTAYAVWGGRAAGGSKREWFVDGPVDDKWPNPITCKSLTEAVELINGI